MQVLSKFEGMQFIRDLMSNIRVKSKYIEIEFIFKDDFKDTLIPT